MHSHATASAKVKYRPLRGVNDTGTPRPTRSGCEMCIHMRRWQKQDSVSAETDQNWNIPMNRMSLVGSSLPDRRSDTCWLVLNDLTKQHLIVRMQNELSHEMESRSNLLSRLLVRWPEPVTCSEPHVSFACETAATCRIINEFV